VKRLDREYLDLLLAMTATEFRRAYRRSFFGVLWSVLNPLLIVVVLFAIFRFRFASEIDSYPIYLLAGVVPYSHFANATSSSIGVLQSMKSLTVGATFPKEILVLGTVFARTLDFVLSLAFCVVIAIVAGVRPGAALLMLPAVVVLELLLALWVSLALALSYVFVRDVRSVYQVFLRILFVATPIFYPSSLLGDGAARRLVELNPLATVIAFARSILIEDRAPGAAEMLVFLAVNAALVALSLEAFRRLEPSFAERV
jgi:ABC-type polysaccharide/polyol phosphate export permease